MKAAFVMPESTDDEIGDNEAELQKILIEATEWYTKSIGDLLTDADRANLNAWLASDKRHVDAFRHVDRLWCGSGEIPEIKEPSTKGANISRRDIGKVAIALAAGGAAWWLLSNNLFSDYRTGSGEVRSVRAPDGSDIELAPWTTLSFEFEKGIRKVILHSGEAFFKIQADSRPFSVVAGPGEISALGTEFVVRYRDEIALVTVAESAARVVVGNSEAIVRAGFEVSYDKSLGVVGSANLDQALAWRERRLVFNGTPLGSVATELNLWQRGRIVILGETLRKRPVTLFLNLDSPDSIGEQLERALPVRRMQITSLLTFLLPQN